MQVWFEAGVTKVTRCTYNIVFIDHFFYLGVGVQFIHKLKIWDNIVSDTHTLQMDRYHSMLRCQNLSQFKKGIWKHIANITML